MQEDKRWAAYLSRSLVIIDDQRWSSMMAEAGSMEWSRSLKKIQGEERWRVVKSAWPLFTRANLLYTVGYVVFVKSEEYFWK